MKTVFQASHTGFCLKLYKIIPEYICDYTCAYVCTYMCTCRCIRTDVHCD